MTPNLDLKKLFKSFLKNSFLRVLIAFSFVIASAVAAMHMAQVAQAVTPPAEDGGGGSEASPDGGGGGEASPPPAPPAEGGGDSGGGASPGGSGDSAAGPAGGPGSEDSVGGVEAGGLGDQAAGLSTSTTMAGGDQVTWGMTADVGLVHGAPIVDPEAPKVTRVAMTEGTVEVKVRTSS